jgi:hypothetical protein
MGGRKAEFQLIAMTYGYFAACYAHRERLDEAREIVRRLRAITPIVAPRGGGC